MNAYAQYLEIERAKLRRLMDLMGCPKDVRVRHASTGLQEFVAHYMVGPPEVVTDGVCDVATTFGTEVIKLQHYQDEDRRDIWMGYGPKSNLFVWWR